MQTRKVTFRSLAVLLLILLVGSCGGDSGGDSDDRTPLQRAISGTWVSPCSNGDWERFVFDEASGALERTAEEFTAADCSSGDATVKIRATGSYRVGPELDCPSGSNGRCAQLDVTWDTGGDWYSVYAVDTDANPDELYSSQWVTDPAARPADVSLSGSLTRIPFPGLQGEAVVGVTLRDGGCATCGGTPPAPPPGYELLDMDLNDGTGGNYIWLYYQVGPADGSKGRPIGELYTVDAYDGEKPKSVGTKIPVDLNAGSPFSPPHGPLWLYSVEATSAVARCVVVANLGANKGSDVPVIKYGPPEAEGQYRVVWVQELEPDSWKNSTPGYPADVQDLNEGESNPFFFILSDYIYIGYCVD